MTDFRANRDLTGSSVLKSQIRRETHFSSYELQLKTESTFTLLNDTESIFLLSAGSTWNIYRRIDERTHLLPSSFLSPTAPSPSSRLSSSESPPPLLVSCSTGSWRGRGCAQPAGSPELLGVEERPESHTAVSPPQLKATVTSEPTVNNGAGGRVQLLRQVQGSHVGHPWVLPVRFSFKEIHLRLRSRTHSLRMNKRFLYTEQPLRLKLK